MPYEREDSLIKDYSIANDHKLLIDKEDLLDEVASLEQHIKELKCEQNSLVKRDKAAEIVKEEHDTD